MNSSSARRWSMFVAAACLAIASASAEEKKEAPEGDAALQIEGAVVCLSVDGFEDYEERPEAELTSDEKLLVYYRPRRYKVVPKGDRFAAHFTQDGQVRAAGKKKVLLRKAKLLDYEAVSKRPPDELYISNTFSLKGLPPGEYEYDMILRDENAEKATVTASVKFRVIAAKIPKADDEARKPE